ncbi:MAG: serine protein kinase RIO [Candidatus Bathyarchaeota archaeon]|nr:serine protein kinase RIO [Candidatus Bathyarchaeota archaeon]
MSNKARERIKHKEKLIEKRDKMLKHDFSSERATVEEVFDNATFMVIYALLKKGILDELNGVVNAGKESRVYWGKDPEGKDLAVKIYLTSSAEFKKGMLKYIQGDYRFKRIKRDTKSLIFTWAQKEYRNLEQAYRAKVRVPKPIAIKNNVLVMEFIGEEGVNAPSLKKYQPENPDKIYNTVLLYIRRLYQKADLVHGDLSEYNIMIWKNKPVIFDVSQAVPSTHPLAKFLLNRDLKNINRFFKSLGVNVCSVDETFKKVVNKNL